VLPHEQAESWFENVGATVMGRNMFGGGPGARGEDPWMGVWGEEPPYHHAVFILTHHPRERLHATKRRNRCVDYDPGR
jgi:dihydrofolate reductase